LTIPPLRGGIVVGIDLPADLAQVREALATKYAVGIFNQEF